MRYQRPDVGFSLRYRFLLTSDKINLSRGETMLNEGEVNAFSSDPALFYATIRNVTSLFTAWNECVVVGII